MTKWKLIAEDNGDFFPICLMYDCLKDKVENLIGIRPDKWVHIGRNSVWEVAVDISSWKKVGETAYKKVKEDPNFLKETRKNILKNSKILIDFCENVNKTDLSKLSNKELSDLFQEYRKKNKDLYVWGMIPVFIDFEVTLLSDELRDILQKKFDNDKAIDYFITLTTPKEETILKQEQKSLLKITKLISENPKTKELFKKSVGEIKKELKNFKEIDSLIEKHTEKYSFFGYCYLGPAWLKEHFLKSIREIKGDPSKKLRAFEIEDKMIQNKKQKILADFLDYEKNVANIAEELAFLKLYRKDTLYKSYSLIHNWLEEVSKRFGINIKQLRHMQASEIEDWLVNRNKFDIKIINERIRLYAYILQDGKLTLLSGKEAQKFLDAKVEKVEVGDVNELKGECACKGNSIGVVKIIKTTKDIAKMDSGDVLVSPATNPNLVPAMEKASAIVTDEGGITCHAAIVSREMNIPCVIGTKIATKALKDGDRVEVDAEKGIVRKIK